MRLALFQPDIPQNFGAMLRLTACMGVSLHVIHPCSFVLSDKNLKRVAMDYRDLAHLTHHDDWGAYQAYAADHRLRTVLMTTRASQPLHQFAFTPSDVILMGRESAGVPDAVHDAAQARLHIPMPGGGRSLNVALAASMALFEGLRQTSSLTATGGV